MAIWHFWQHKGVPSNTPHCGFWRRKTAVPSISVGDTILNLAPASSTSPRSDVLPTTTMSSSSRDPMLYYFSEQQDHHKQQQQQQQSTTRDSKLNFGPDLDDDGFILHNVQLT
jgi:hypothetical protein